MLSLRNQCRVCPTFARMASSWASVITVAFDIVRAAQRQAFQLGSIAAAGELELANGLRSL